MKITCKAVRRCLVAMAITVIFNPHAAAAQPHVAYHALLALSALCRLPNIAMRVRKQLPAIEQAQQIGLRCHAALEQASSRLLVELHV